MRHGESESIAEGECFPKWNGHGDPALHERGEEQARLLADRLEDVEIAAIYVTPLQRTAQTAAPLAARKGIVPRVSEDLREVHLGDWDGTGMLRTLSSDHPVVAQMRAEERWDVIPNAEPADQFRARIQAGVSAIAADHQGKTVVVVAHGGVIGEIFALASRAERNFAFVGADNCSISHLIVDGDGRWIVRRFNDTSHLRRSFNPAALALT
ncbi:histidine phosphatase family protein [Georgenia ruanii]|uniref:histidine phosphatase family protein n=1 Tax=Georgenia ruanii TaxID=348442 RepID=UPI0022211E2B|nr:histidine phosphatase family protein [Georgenia ruanii]